MNFDIEFDTFRSKDSLISETKEYFIAHGFNVARFENDFMEFERGRVFLNKFKFHPLKWKSNTKVSIQENGKIKAHISIDLTNQIVTLKEQMHWKNFIENYKIKLTSVDSRSKTNHNELAQIKKQTFLRLSKLFGLLLIFTTLILLFVIFINY